MLATRRTRIAMDAAARPPRLDDRPVSARGLPAFLYSVALTHAWIPGLAGISAGFFVWYEQATHRALSSSDSDLLLALWLLLGCAGAICVWLVYSRFVSRLCSADQGSILRLDAYTYVPFFGLWLFFFALAPSLRHAVALVGLIALLSACAKLFVLGRYSAMVRSVSAVFVATRVPLILIAPLASIVIGQRKGQHFSPAHGPLLDVWGRWDAQHYLSIATAGYHGKDVAFFPLYPYLMHVLGGLIGDHLVAGLIISNLAFFVALAYLYALVKLEFGDDMTAFHAIFYIAIFPTAIFFSAVYTESLFLALTVASVFYARRGNFISAGVFGGLAALTRVEGVLTMLPLAYEMVHAWRERRGTTLTRGVIGLLLVPGGLGIYMGYLYALVADPLYFLRIQNDWNRHLAAPWVSMFNTWREIRAHALASSLSANLLIELVFTGGFLILMIVAFRRLRPSYALYFAASLLLPMSTASLMSMPRFVLVIFPAFMLLALWGRRPEINSLIVSLSLPVLGLFTVLFANWYWLA